jgi:TetR/AcrR family transcriptional regulator, acrAB operon repressor
MRKTKEEAAITRQILLKAALSVFSRKGYAATTLEDIAQEAGVTRGAIYWHFGSKVELYMSLIETYAVRGNEIVGQVASEGGSFVEVILRIFIRMLEAVEDDNDLRAVMELSLFKTEYLPELEPMRQQSLQRSRAMVESIAGWMHQGIASGAIRSGVDPLDLARSFLAYQDGAIYMWLSDPQAFSLKERAEALADIYLKGVLSGREA